jgi:hypothetical protein
VCVDVPEIFFHICVVGHIVGVFGLVHTSVIIGIADQLAEIIFRIDGSQTLDRIVNHGSQSHCRKSLRTPGLHQNDMLVLKAKIHRTDLIKESHNPVITPHAISSYPAFHRMINTGDNAQLV